MLTPITKNIFCSVKVKKKFGGVCPIHAPHLWGPLLPPLVGMGSYGVSLLCKLSFIVEAVGPVRDTQPRLNQSNLLFPEPEIRILKCWPDSADLLSQTLMWSGVSGRRKEGWSTEREKLWCSYADKNRHKRPRGPREMEKLTWYWQLCSLWSKSL